MKRSKHVLGRLFALSLLTASTGQAAVQTFTDERDQGPSLPPVIISAVLTDPYASPKPIQHQGYADFAYWYTAGLNWHDSTADIADGFTASLHSPSTRPTSRTGPSMCRRVS